MKGKLFVLLIFITIDFFTWNILIKIGLSVLGLWTSISFRGGLIIRRQEFQFSRTNLLILSHMRSGSSFLGQIFNHRDDVFFVYEPFYVLRSTTLAYSSFYESSALRLLNDILSCSFESQEEFLNFLTNLPHRRYSSRALTLPYCTFNHTSRVTGKKKYICRALEPKFTSQVCLAHKHRVIKLLSHRIPNFTVNFFKPLILSFNVKILHLVRDPRAIIASMETVGWVPSYIKTSNQKSSVNTFKSRVKRFCKSMVDMVKFMLEAEKSLSEKYKLLRYEDLVDDITKSAHDIMTFAGFQSSDDFLIWLQKSTHGAIETDFRRGDYHYTTNRNNISTLVQSWRYKLKANQILIVEKYCKHAMTILNYPTVFS
ncbi:carbohydrate sulfotransferase 1 [Exaiptasia diaphana]|uniref:Sulfotransferase domain-containing protein n=1 Tax=Exaiptasia diaphana TaxID=2652724 RepID=A0A913XK68_EXADI|nr:carbohydrate sulfotransferase 1 [Exaiptasia diaphana]